MTKPVDVEQTEHEKTNQNWCAVATGLQVKTEAQAAEIKRLTALLAQANATYVGMEAEIERLRDALISALMLRQH